MRITKYDVPNLEAIWIEVTWISQRLLVGCVYRPPDCTDFFGKFHSVVEKMWQSKKNVVIVGDLNADQLSSNWNGSKLKRICQALLHGGCALCLTLWIMLPARGKVCTRISAMVTSPLVRQKIGSSLYPVLIRKYGKLYKQEVQTT